MVSRKIYLSITALLVWAHPVAAASTSEVLPKCEAALNLRNANEQDLVDASYCFGMIQGVAQIAGMNCEIAKVAGLKPIAALSHSAPHNTSLGALVQIYVNWARANPEKWGEPAPIGIATSLGEVFKC